MPSLLSSPSFPARPVALALLAAFAAALALLDGSRPHMAVAHSQALSPTAPDVRQANLRQGGVADPSKPGPYNVGVTRRTLERESTNTGQPRPMELVIWYPSSAAADAAVSPELWGVVDAAPARAAGPYPVVVWSHGAESEPWTSTFFTTHLATHGFVVVAPPHAGTRTNDCPDPCDIPRHLELPRTREAIANRPDEVIAAREHLAALGAGPDPILGGLVDAERAGVAGHSIGAATAIVAAGIDPRFKALVAMATVPSAEGLVRQGAARVKVPTMLMGGGRDHLETTLRQRQLYGAFGDVVKERWLVLLPRAGHLAFQDSCFLPVAGCGPDDLSLETGFRLIDRWATAFLLRYVAGDARYTPLLDPLQVDGTEAEVSFGTGA